jgi:hypothetical protein
MLHFAGGLQISHCLMWIALPGPVVIRAVRDRLAGSLGSRAKLRKLSTLALEQSLHDFQLDPECLHSSGKMEFGVIDFSFKQLKTLIYVRHNTSASIIRFAVFYRDLVAYNVPARRLPFQPPYFLFCYLSDREFLSLIRKLRDKDIKVAKQRMLPNPF